MKKGTTIHVEYILKFVNVLPWIDNFFNGLAILNNKEMHLPRLAENYIFQNYGFKWALWQTIVRLKT